jgi:hypothetical protein
MTTHFTTSERRATGWSALIGVALCLGGIALYFVYSGPPPLENVLVRNLVMVATFIAFLVFAVGLSRMLRSARGGDAGMAGQVSIAALLTYIGITLVSMSLEVGTSLQYPDGSLDPTVDGPLSASMVMLHGPIARALVATFLIGLVVALAGRSYFSSRVLTGSVVVAIVNLAMIPSVFNGMDAANAYASNGWGSVASMGAINMIWFAVIGRAVLHTKSPAQPRSSHEPVASVV